MQTSFSIRPIVHGIFDLATWTVTYVVYDKEGGDCAIIDSVLDYDSKSGRTRTQSADQVIAFVRMKNLKVVFRNPCPCRPSHGSTLPESPVGWSNGHWLPHHSRAACVQKCVQFRRWLQRRWHTV